MLNDNPTLEESGLIIYDFFQAIDKNEKVVPILKYYNYSNTDIIDKRLSGFDVKNNLTI